MSGRPEVKISLASKGKDGEREYVDLFAFWRNERGQLGGKVDRGVAAIKIVRKDGTQEVIKPDEKGYLDGWFINAKVESAGESTQQRAQRPSNARSPQSSGKATAFEDDFVDDSIPFDGAH
ncbi:MAG: hypothetical protein IPK80_02460 [Nannocystis sp.]|nr:hypothetical protein [Nannocystis sp.]